MKKYPKQKFDDVHIEENTWEVISVDDQYKNMQFCGMRFEHWTTFFVHVIISNNYPDVPDGLYNTIREQMKVTKQDVIEKCRDEFKSNKQLVRELYELINYMGTTHGGGFTDDFRRRAVEDGLGEFQKLQNVSPSLFQSICAEMRKTVHPPGIMRFTHRKNDAVWQYIESNLMLDPVSVNFENDLHENLDRITEVYDEEIRKQYRKQFRGKLAYMIEEESKKAITGGG